jgi:solute:Na+ symporter, SSS family
LLTRRATQNGAIVGMLCGLGLNIYIWGWTHIAWTWYVTFGSVTTFVVGYLASLATPASEPAQNVAPGAGR